MNTYDHHAAIYLLLLERLRIRSMSQENGIGIPNNQLNGTTHVVNVHSMKYPYPTLEQQRRRPSSIAEQAMRKLGISNNHHASLAASTEIPLEAMPSLLTLRDTSIREQTPSPSATIPSALHYLRDSNGGLYSGTSMLGSSRERSSREFQSPYGAYSSLAVTGRENSCLLSREMGPGCCYPPNRASSNRLLMNNGIDQRIIKQSTEDCRRLLQQVSSKL